jgi:hypothetical protein
MKVLSALIVVLLLMNPDVAHMGALLDAVGLDMLLMLFGVQLMALALTFMNAVAAPAARSCAGRVMRRSFRGFVNAARVAVGALFPASRETALMHLLVVSSFVSAVLDITWR